jgi:hypothetical protein
MKSFKQEHLSKEHGKNSEYNSVHSVLPWLKSVKGKFRGRKKMLPRRHGTTRKKFRIQLRALHASVA